MEFPAVTYAAQSVSYAPFSYGTESANALSAPASSLTDGFAAFLLRVAAYFQGCLASLPRMCASYKQPAIQESVTVMDAALEGSSEPLIKVTMNRALTRRMRWLIKRGRVQRSGRLRVCSAAAEARCNLTPGQFIEYCIRVNGRSRVLAYALNRGGRIVNKGGVLSLGMAGGCDAILSPD